MRALLPLLATTALLLTGCADDAPTVAGSPAPTAALPPTGSFSPELPGTPAAATPTPLPSSAPPVPRTTTAAPAAPAPRRTAEAVVARVVARGFDTPWGLAFLPDGSALVSERDSARIWQVTPAGAKKVVATVPGVQPTGEGGLLGLAARDGWVYAYYTAAADNRIVRFRLADPGAQTVLLAGIPKAGNHNGGRLAFGPDGMLYAGTGDAGDTSRSQDKGSLGGKVLRLKPTGGAADGNPFGSPVWSLGHRNVQGLAFDAQGRLWASEFGQNTYDEVNLVERGGNYGWPEVEGQGTGGGRFVSPQVVWSTDQASPSGVAFAGGELHVAALRGTRLWDVPLSGARAGTPVARYRGTYGRIRSATTEPGGRAVWLTTSNCDGRGDCPSTGDVVVRVPL